MHSMIQSNANRIWVFLMVATGITYWVGESAMSQENAVRALLVIFGLAFVKGFLIVYEYMEVRHAPTRWKIGLVGWLVFVISLILFAYWLGQRSH